MALSLCFVLLSVGGARADQVIDVDLFDFPRTGNSLWKDGFGEYIPNLTLYSEGNEAISLNIENSITSFLGFIAQGVDNELELRLNIPEVIDDTLPSFITDDIRILSTAGTDFELATKFEIVLDLGSQATISNVAINSEWLVQFTSDPANIIGWFLFNTTQDENDVVLWKEILIMKPLTASPLIASPSSPATATLTGNTLNCAPGAYSVAGSAVDVNSYVYRLFINDILSSTLVRDNARVIDASLVGPRTSTYSGKLMGTTAIWNLEGLSNFQARCEITAVAMNSMSNSTSATLQDEAFNLASSAKERAWEAQRSSATAANFTEEARAARKRAANR